MTAHDVLALLRRHYLPEGRQPGGIFAPEIQAPTSARRADLIWQPVTNAEQGVLIGHEIKVTRTDLLVELADPTKADPWQRYCDRWWLVVPDPALIDGLDLPPSWGVLAPPSGRRTRSMTVVVAAPELRPVDKAPAYETIARWLHWRHHRQHDDLRGVRREVERLRDEAHELRQRTPRDTTLRSDREVLVEDIVRKLGGAAGRGRVGTWERNVSTDDVVAALLDLGTVYENARRVQWAAERAANAIKSIAGSISPADVSALASAVRNLKPDQKPTEGAA